MTSRTAPSARTCNGSSSGSSCAAHGIGDAYNGFLETFEKAGVPGAPLEYHENAAASLGGIIGTVWAGALMEAGLALAGPAVAELETVTAEVALAGRRVTVAGGSGGQAGEGLTLVRILERGESWGAVQDEMR